MIVLDTTKKLIAVLSGAVTTSQPEFVVSYAAVTNTTFTEGMAVGALNNTTEVDLVTSPVSGQRVIRTAWIFNKDTAAVTVTVSINFSATLRRICKVTLQTEETLEIGEGGVRVITATGAEKTTSEAGHVTGIFIPRLYGSTGSVGSYAVNSQVGRYTKIGNRIFYNFYLELTNKGSWTGNALVDGFPFVAANVTNSYHAPTITYSNITFSASKVGIGGYISPNTVVMTLLENQSGTVGSSLPYANINNTSYLLVSGHYEV